MVRLCMDISRLPEVRAPSSRRGGQPSGHVHAEPAEGHQSINRAKIMNTISSDRPAKSRVPARRSPGGTTSDADRPVKRDPNRNRNQGPYSVRLGDRVESWGHRDTSRCSVTGGEYVGLTLRVDPKVNVQWRLRTQLARMFNSGHVIHDPLRDAGGKSRTRRALMSTGFGVWLRPYRRPGARWGWMWLSTAAEPRTAKSRTRCRNRT